MCVGVGRRDLPLNGTVLGHLRVSLWINGNIFGSMLTFEMF